MKELTLLKKLVEARQGPSKAFQKLFDELEDKIEMASDGIEGVRERLQSSVLTDMLKQEGFPSTESAAAKKAVEVAFQAVNKAFSEIEDLHMVLGTHFAKDN